MISHEKMQRAKAKVQERLAATPPGTWGKMGVGVLVGGLAIGWLAFPYVLDKVVAMQINLSKGKDSRRLWVELPAFDFHAYIFNITNPEEVMRGAKPIVQEIGPYCYREIKDKMDFVEDPTSDTISYSARSTWHENQQAANCPAPQLTGEEMFVVPNVPLLAVLLIAEKDFPAPFLTLVNQALPNIFGKLSDVFMRVSARTLLFGGVSIDCTASALYPRAVCIALKQNSRALKKLGKNKYSFSFFGAKNNTPEEFRYSVKRGTEVGQDIGKLVALDGNPELPFWRGDCNKLQGTDATVFPPFRQKENGSLTAYSSELCRIIFGIYQGEYDYKGVTGYGYSVSFGVSDSNPGDRCFCPADDRCRKKGVLDALKCQGAPIVASHPHFYLGSPDYVNGVVGLNPDKDKHGIFIVLEPISGTPLVVRKRVQFNIEFKPIQYVRVSQRLKRTLVPLFWVEEKLDLDGDLMGLLEASLFLPIRAVDVLKWTCVVGGVALGVVAAALKIRQNKRDKVYTLEQGSGQDIKTVMETIPVIKPVEMMQGNQNLDPFFIDTRDSLNQKDAQERLSAAAFINSTSTMTSANVNRFNVKSGTQNSLEIKDSVDQTQPVSTIPVLSSKPDKQKVDFSTQQLLTGYDSMKLQVNSLKSKHDGHLSDKDSLGIQQAIYLATVTLPQSINSSFEIQTSQSVKEPENEDPFNDTPKSVFQIIPKANDQFETNLLENVNENVNKYQSTNKEEPSNHFEEGPISTKIEDQYIQLNEEQSILNNNSEEQCVNGSMNSERLEKLEIRSTSSEEQHNSVDETVPLGEAFDAFDVETMSTRSIINVKTSDSEISTGSNIATKPPVVGSVEGHIITAEELKEVEEDINKLIAEIAALIPKNS